MRERVIELALSIIAAADDRLNLSRPRSSANQGDLCLGDRPRYFPSWQALRHLSVFLGQQQVHILHTRVDSSGRGALQGRIESGIDTEILT